MTKMSEKLNRRIEDGLLAIYVRIESGATGGVKVSSIYMRTVDIRDEDLG